MDERPTTTRSHLDSQQRAELRHRLEEEERQLRELRRRSIERGQEIPTGEAEDAADRAEESWDREELFARRESVRARLLSVESALESLDQLGTYGFCVHCGEPIPYKRLLAVPTARYCVEHQVDVEHHRLDEV